MIREREYGAVSGGAVLVGLLTVVAFLFWQFVVNISRHSPGMAVACVVGVAVHGVPAHRPVRRQPERGQGAAAVRRTTSARRKTAGLRWANPLLHASGASRCASATSRAASSRSTTSTATRSRSPPSSSGGSSTPPRPCSRWTTTTTTSTCRASRRCATWPPATPTTRTTSGGDVAARPHDGDRRSPADGDPGAPGEGRRRGASRRASATSPTRPRSRPRCCSASRPARSSRRGSASSRARSAWWRWRSTCSRKKNVVELDEERKAAMVSNLLVVLCGERSTQPIVNAGTLHH